MVTKKQPAIVKICSNKKILIERDNMQWIVTDKKTNKQYFYTYLPHMLSDFAIGRVEDKIVEHGFIEILNLIQDIKREICKEISLIGQAIEKSYTKEHKNGKSRPLKNR